MAHLKRRPKRRYRVQFTLNYELGERYAACRRRAQRLRLAIDFGPDFESWFARQLQEIERQLNEMERDEEKIKEERDEF